MRFRANNYEIEKALVNYKGWLNISRTHCDGRGF